MFVREKIVGPRCRVDIFFSAWLCHNSCFCRFTKLQVASGGTPKVASRVYRLERCFCRGWRGSFKIVKKIWLSTTKVLCWQREKEEWRRNTTISPATVGHISNSNDCMITNTRISKMKVNMGQTKGVSTQLYDRKGHVGDQ